MRPELVEGSRSCALRHAPAKQKCAPSLSKGAPLRTSTSSAHMLVLVGSTGSAHVLGYGLLDASRGGDDEMPKHCGLYWIRRGRVFRVPLDAEVPALVILQRHRLDHTVSRVRRCDQANSQPGNALVVIAGDGRPAPDDLTQGGCVVDLEIMTSVPVVANRVVHVLDKIAAECNVDNLTASANRQQRQVVT